MNNDLRIRLIGIIFIIIGILIIVFASFDEKINNNRELIALDKYLEESKIDDDEKIDESLIEEDNITIINEKKPNPNKEILMILEIPKIEFKRGIYYKESKYNNVKYNIQLIKESNMPDKKNSNLIIAGHNGNSKVAFFKNLKKLSLEDEVFIYYNGVKYIYKLDNIYLINKDGMAEIYRNKDKNTITLITCNRKDRTKQEVYIGYLDRTEKY